jgi:carboxy-cis,cis-muconate cyclase
MYDIHKNGTAELLSINLSPEEHDGPRNVYPSEDGKWLYVVRTLPYLFRHAAD